MARHEPDSSHLATTTSERMLKTFTRAARALGAGNDEAQRKVRVTRQLAYTGLCGVAQHPGRTELKPEAQENFPLKLLFRSSEAWKTKTIDSHFTVRGFHPVRTVSLAQCCDARRLLLIPTHHPNPDCLEEERGLRGEMGSGGDVSRSILCLHP
ncbi:unnamed protein product [Pleuronectes platessa]|uniref:Uncharacterized protein n=1 Tax=Pleuronectes platessa TaxID=8262 RepID=A0A9N7U2Q3_PLEPL|nr:unnamed protein product [Pleuronectes platessa]